MHSQRQDRAFATPCGIDHYLAPSSLSAHILSSYSIDPGLVRLLAVATKIADKLQHTYFDGS